MSQPFDFDAALKALQSGEARPMGLQPELMLAARPVRRSGTDALPAGW